MSTEHDLPRADAGATLADLAEQVRDLGPVTAEEHTAREKRREDASRQLIEDARRKDAKARYELACPQEFRESNWDFPSLQPFRGQINRVLGYQLGPKGILASGPTGRRKTGAMWALMERLACQEGRDVRFYTAFDFFAQLQEQVKYGHDDARGWVEAVARRPIVFIDDYGQQTLLKSREDWALGWFFRFLDIRAGDHLPLFVTTNMTAVEMAGGNNMRGDPLIRRMLMVADPIPFETDDERRARIT